MTEYCIFKTTQNKCKTLPVMSHKLFYKLDTKGIHIAHTKISKCFKRSIILVETMKVNGLINFKCYIIIEYSIGY